MKFCQGISEFFGSKLEICCRYSCSSTFISKHRGNSDILTLSAVELHSCRNPGRQSSTLLPMAHPDIVGIFLESAGGLFLFSLHTHYVAIELCKTCKEHISYYLFISMASVHLKFHASLCLHVIILYIYLNCFSCLWSWDTKATLNSFSIIYFYKRTTVKINQRYAAFYCYFFNFGGYFSSYCSGFEIETLHCWESAMKI